MNQTKREWIIQRWLPEDNLYEDWPKGDGILLTRPEMLKSLEKAERENPTFEFRGHNVANQRAGKDRLRMVR